MPTSLESDFRLAIPQVRISRLQIVTVIAMLSVLPAGVRGVLTSLTLLLSTCFLTLLMMVPALLKLLPFLPLRRTCDFAMTGLASAWVEVNNCWIAAVRPALWDVRGLDGLHPRGWYLISANHQSWCDILVLQRIFHGKPSCGVVAGASTLLFYCASDAVGIFRSDSVPEILSQAGADLGAGNRPRLVGA